MNFTPLHQVFENDPYFQEEYIRCYLTDEQEIFDFEFQDGDDFFRFRAIKNPIKEVGNQNIDEHLFDLETAYGYGGYITNSDSEKFVENAFSELKTRCKKENIVAHFMRFHPTNSFPVNFSSLLDLSAINRHVIFVDASRDQESRWSGYSSSLRRNIRKAQKLGLEARELETSNENAAQFLELYHTTMQKKDAAEMYFFDKSYFRKLFDLPQLKLYGTFYQDQLISMITTLESDEYNFYHLGATHPDFYSYNPNPFILDFIAQKSFEKTQEFLFLGGGNTFDESDPLFKFKKKFSDQSEDFYIGGHVFIPEKFSELKKMAADQVEDLPKMFLAHRFV